jgi:hypothetical protein
MAVRERYPTDTSYIEFGLGVNWRIAPSRNWSTADEAKSRRPLWYCATRICGRPSSLNHTVLLTKCVVFFSALINLGISVDYRPTQISTYEHHTKFYRTS